jgi:hypothetical protein
VNGPRLVINSSGEDQLCLVPVHPCPDKFQLEAALVLINSYVECMYGGLSAAKAIKDGYAGLKESVYVVVTRRSGRDLIASLSTPTVRYEIASSRHCLQTHILSRITAP